jgi:Ca2+-binding EF-hand superfamily protein
MSGISGISGYTNYSYTQAMPMAQGRKGKDDLFTKIDSDGSGKVSQAELEAFTSKMSQVTGATAEAGDFSTYDADGDGELSEEELQSFLDANRPQQPPMGMMGMPPGPSPEEMFSQADTDGSGGLGQDEIDVLVSTISQATGTTVDTTSAISDYDTDGDNELSMGELKGFLDASGLKPPAPPAGGMAGAAGSTSTEDDLFDTLTESISAFDTDGDGNLSKEELKSFLASSTSKYSADYILKALTAYTSGTYGTDFASSVSLDA